MIEAYLRANNMFVDYNEVSCFSLSSFVLHLMKLNVINMS